MAVRYNVNKTRRPSRRTHWTWTRPPGLQIADWIWIHPGSDNTFKKASQLIVISGSFSEIRYYIYCLLLFLFFFTHTHTHTYICVCVCVWVYIYKVYFHDQYALGRGFLDWPVFSPSQIPLSLLFYSSQSSFIYNNADWKVFRLPLVSCNTHVSHKRRYPAFKKTKTFISRFCACFSETVYSKLIQSLIRVDHPGILRQSRQLWQRKVH